MMIYRGRDDIDVAEVRNSVDLLALASKSTELRKESGGSFPSYAGPCPWCGGTDRLVVRPNGDETGRGPAWWCRKCHVEAGSCIDWIMRRDGLDFRSALEELAGGVVSGAPAARRKVDAEIAKVERKIADLTGELDHLRRWHRALLARRDMLADLERGGIGQYAVEHFEFGFGDWYGRPALVIPWRAAGVTESIQYRLVSDMGGDRYRWHEGTSGRLFNADAVLEPQEETVIITEGAKKAAAVWTAGFASVTAVPNNTSAARIAGEFKQPLAAFDRVYVLLDPDSWGHAVNVARAIGDSARVVVLPAKVDDWLVTMGDPGMLDKIIKNARPA